MTPKPVNIAILISAGVQHASQRWQLLAMAAVLYGIVSSVVNQPAFEILEAFSAAANSTANQTENSGSIDYSGELAVLSEGLPTLIWVFLATTALGALLLVPWSRAIAPVGLVPSEGDTKTHATRLIRSFSHYITATLLMGAALIVGGMVITMLGSIIGFLAMPLVFAGALSFVWLTIILNAVANYAVIFEAQDKPISYADAWRKFRPAFVPLSACLAAFYMASIIVGFVINGLFGPTGMGLPLLGMAVNGAVSFCVGALHIAALTHYNSLR